MKESITVLDVISKLGTPLLRNKVHEVDNISDKEVRIVNKMKFVLKKCDGFGLAANQINIDEAIFVWSYGNYCGTIINPRLSEFDSELWLYRESCLSIPGFSFDIWRPRRVLLRGIDLDGNDVRVEADDLLARIFQHEIDHLLGKLVLDYLSSDELVDFSKAWRKRK